KDDRGDEVPAPSEPLGEERGHGQHHDVGQDVPGGHPADLLLGSAQIPGHLGQRDVYDGGVEHLHDRGGDQAQQDEPAVLIDVGGGRSGRGRPGGGGGHAAYGRDTRYGSMSVNPVPAAGARK